MLKRSVLALGAPVLLAFAACGGQTGMDADPSMAGASSNGGSGGQGADSGSGSTSGDGTGGAGGSSSGGANSGGSGSQHIACLPGTYDTDTTDDELTCAPWSECPPGQRFVTFGTFEKDTVCADCEEGTFSETGNTVSCKLWTACRFGQQEESAPSATNDRVCEAADVFPEYVGYGYAGPLAVTTAGVHIAVGGQYEQALIVRYPLDGDDLDLWEGESSIGAVPDLTHLGTDLYLAGWGTLWDEQGLATVEAGFVQKFEQGGAVEWTHRFGEAPEEFVLWARVAAHDDAVYVVTHSLVYDCPLIDGSFDCYGVAKPNWNNLTLWVLDPAGDVQEEVLLDEDTNVLELLDVAIATDGHLYAAVRTDVPDPDFVQPEQCDELTPGDDEYYYYCVAPLIPADQVLEYDTSHMLLEEHEVEGTLVGHLSADDAGNVYAISNIWQESMMVLHRMGSFGGLDSFDLDLEASDAIDTFSASASGVLLLGYANEGPLLVQTNPTGSVQSRDVLEDVANSGYLRFTGVHERDDGAVLFSGGDYSGGSAFVSIWPE